MTLKSKKLYSTGGNKRNNIRTKMHGGSKFTVVGHDAEDPVGSDFYETGNTDEPGKYLFSENDQKLISEFLKTKKGENTEHFESLEDFVTKLQGFDFDGTNLIKKVGDFTLMTGQ